MSELCIDPGKIQDWEYEAFADGEEIPAVAEHIKVCAACREKINSIIADNRQIKMALTPQEACPTSSTLQLFLQDALPEETQRSVKQHISYCVRCVEELIYLEYHSKNTTPKHTIDVIDLLKNTSQKIQITVARLLQPQKLSPVLRGQSTKKQHLFEADDAAISIEIQQNITGEWLLTGQLLASEAISPATVRIEAKHVENTLPPISITNNGTFEATIPQPDTYQFIFQLPSKTIIIPNFQIGDISTAT